MTNRARLLQSLDQDGGIENGILIAPAVHEVIDLRVIPFDPLPRINIGGCARARQVRGRPSRHSAPRRPERDAGRFYRQPRELIVLGKPILFPKGHVGGTPRWSTGISSTSKPLEEDMVLAGYMKVGVSVSSRSRDMDVHASLRVIDENDREIRYEAIVMPIDPEHIHQSVTDC